MNGAYRSPVKPAFTDPVLCLPIHAVLHACAALLSSGNICDGTSLKSSLLIVPEKGNGTWESASSTGVRVPDPMSNVSSIVKRTGVVWTIPWFAEILAVYFQHAGAALGHARVLVLEVKFESMLAGR